MDPPLDPPLLAAQTAVPIPTTAAAAAATVNSSPVQAAALNHPPYAEMISAAIAAMKEPDGSSRRAIAKYIETHYSNLPPTHSALLTHHLKRLKTNGQLLMVKHSYTLPGARSVPAAVNGAVAVESPADPSSAVAKRRPGRPPKPKPDAVQVAVPVFPHPIDMNDAPEQPFLNIAPQENAYIATAQVPVNGASTVTPGRGRGRPPKQGGAKRGRGRPPKIGGSGGGSVSGRSRGRPRKNFGPVSGIPTAAGVEKGTGRPRGRPPKPINVVSGFTPSSDGISAAGGAPPAVTLVSGKRRGRPPKAGNEAKKPRYTTAALPRKLRRLSGKPLGRPKKNGQAATVNRTPDSQLLVAYLDLKAKLETLQSMVKQTATLIRPSLNSEAAINAMQELELVAMNAGVPPNVHTLQQQPPPPPEQAQPSQS